MSNRTFQTPVSTLFEAHRTGYWKDSAAASMNPDTYHSIMLLLMKKLGINIPTLPGTYRPWLHGGARLS